MKQIILATNDREKYEKEITARGFFVTWCPLTLEGILKVRDMSDYIIVCIGNEDEEELKQIGFYLRDLCIEYEKIIYIYGRQVGVDIIRSRVPSLYVRKKLYLYSQPFSAIPDDLAEQMKPSGVEKPGFLILDDDTEYVGKLRLGLEPYYQIYVSHFDMSEAGVFLKRSKIMLLSLDAKLSLLEYMGLFSGVAARRKHTQFRLYYLASNDADRDKINVGSEKAFIAFSKTMDASKVAKFFTAGLTECR